MRIHLLENPVQRYAWGSANGITEALGIPNPGGGPVAELWMGAHPSAPSTALLGGRRVGLDAMIALDPEGALGERAIEKLGPSLPFLFKVLSAGSPLSIQAHPSKRKAVLGFERENLGGIPIDAPERNYRDPNHKPEMAVALTRFELLCGFRPIEEILENLRILSIPGFERVLARLAKNPGRVELSVLFYDLFSMNERDRSEMLTLARSRIDGALARGEQPDGIDDSLHWSLKLMDRFPKDAGALTPLILNHIVLEPGQGAFIAPGELHAHLSGTCLEIMANSDNVIRGALTSKYVDLPELVSVLSFNPERVVPVLPRSIALYEEAYPVFVPDFQLSRIALGRGESYRRSSRSPEILLCASGRVELDCPGEDAFILEKGESVFAPADSPEYALSAGDQALLFRATVPEIL